MSVIDKYLQGDSRSKTWIKAHLDYPHEFCCLIWPYPRSQTGYAMFGKPAVRVHRVMCEYKNGPPPTPEHYAAHSCDRGHEGCVNPHHLRWETPSENQLDRFRDRAVRPARKLTVEMAREIRELKGLEPILETAARFGVSESNVRLIQSGKTWRHDRRTQRVFSREEVELIRSTPWQVKPAAQFAEEFGVHHSVIERIRAGTTYRYFETSEAPAERGGER